MTGTPDEMTGLAEFLYLKGIDVFVPQLAGHGKSVDELRTTRCFRWIHDAEEIMERVHSSAKYERIFAVGLSFGTLLASYLALEYDDEVTGLIVLSPPMLLRSSKSEFILTFLSFLPEACLSLLGVSKKAERPAGIFVTPRNALNYHSIGALARMFRIRRYMAKRLSRLKCPVVLLQDSNDHLLSPLSAERFAEIAGKERVRIVWIPDGEHELTLGHKFREVLEEVYSFINSCPSGNLPSVEK